MGRFLFKRYFLSLVKIGGKGVYHHANNCKISGHISCVFCYKYLSKTNVFAGYVLEKSMLNVLWLTLLFLVGKP